MNELLKYLQLLDTAVLIVVIFSAGRIYQKIQAIEKVVTKDERQTATVTRHDEKIRTLAHEFREQREDYNNFKRECVQARLTARNRCGHTS